MVVILNPDTDDESVDIVKTFGLVVSLIVRLSGYFNMITPDPPAYPLAFQ